MTRQQPTTRGFTLIELLVTIAIISLLIAIGVVALSRALRSATEAADAAAVRSIRVAAETFEQDHGFVIPLAYDGDPLQVDGPADLTPANLYNISPDGLPVFLDGNLDASRPQPFIGVYLRGKDLDFFRGGDDAVGNRVVQASSLSDGLSDARYSKFSLAVYLTGLMPASVDGRDGILMSPPDSDGSFQGVGIRGSAKTIEAYVPVGENDSFSTRVLYNGAPDQPELREAAEHGGSTPGGESPHSIAVVDRYGTPFRYYRWEPGRSSAGVAAYGGEEGEVSAAADLNIPVVLQDLEAFWEQVNGGDENADGAGSARLRSARWAVVSAGPDGLFGTEALADLGLNPSSSEDAILEARMRAMEDNAVEVGP